MDDDDGSCCSAAALAAAAGAAGPLGDGARRPRRQAVRRPHNVRGVRRCRLRLVPEKVQVRHVCQPRLWRLHSGGLIRSLGTGGRERGRTGPATAVALGELPIVGAVPRMKWDLSDPNFATTLARRRTPVVLTDSPASAAWRGFDRWAEPGYLEQQLTEPLNFAKSYDPNFMYYNKRHGWAEEARRIKAAPAQRLGAANSDSLPFLFLSLPRSLCLFLCVSLYVCVFSLLLCWCGTCLSCQCAANIRSWLG